MSARLGIIIFGATGFTGKRTIPELNRIIKSEGLSITWGVAGRSEKKLKDALAEAEKKTGDDFSNIPLVVADVDDQKSLLRMTAQAHLIINTIGPYRFYGETIVKACLETSTHHIDVSGEPAFNEKIQLKYHNEAKKKGVYLISSCGFDSLLVDVGAMYLLKNFGGTLNSIESYVCNTEKHHTPGPEMNYATWVSAIHGIANYKELISIRSKLFSKKLPQMKPKLLPKQSLSKDTAIDRWIVPFPGSDRSVMQRTQRYLYELYKQRPVQIQSYFTFEEFHNAVLAIVCGMIFFKVCQYEWGRSLLLKHPKLFSLGTFTLEGPSDEKQQNTNFQLILEGEGWSEKLSEATDQFDTLPNKKKFALISGNNPAYGTTSTAVSLAAIMILTESQNMPEGGGCYPPGFAFAETTIIEKLNKYGTKFELKSKL